MRVALLACLYCAATWGQFVVPPRDLISAKGYLGIPVRYKQVPNGICETDSNVKSFSGYVDVGENEHTFFWFFEARNQDPTDAPLTVWINGGPGSSSMIGLFQENGPCGVDSNGSVYNNPYSWSNVSNMLYIDQPVQVGLSYSIPVPGYSNNILVPGYVDSYTKDVITLPSPDCPDYAENLGCGTYSYPNISLTANSTDRAAATFYKTVQGFMGAFPEYSREGFHIATESYGGHWGPVFSEYIEQQNRKPRGGAKKINLKSLLVINGWYDPIIQYEAYYNFTVNPGNTYNYQPFNKSISSLMYNNLYGEGNCLSQLRDCAARSDNAICNVATTFCSAHVENFLGIYQGRDELDIRELSPDPFPYSFYSDYLNTPSVQEAIGAFVNFTDQNNAVFEAFSSTGDNSRSMHTKEDVAALLTQGVTVVMLAGDADYNCNWLGGEAVALAIGAAGFEHAGYTDILTSDGIVHGQVRQAGQFAFARVYESGHEVPFYQPLLSLELLERVLNGNDVATGKIKVSRSYLSVGPSKSTYREGNRTMQWHVLDPLATYNTSTNAPNPLNETTRNGLEHSSLRF